MKFNHATDPDYDFFAVEGAPERTSGLTDGWRIESCKRLCLVTEFEFFDAEVNKLFPCSLVPASDLAQEIDEMLEERFEASL